MRPYSRSGSVCASSTCTVEPSGSITSVLAARGATRGMTGSVICALSCATNPRPALEISPSPNDQTNHVFRILRILRLQLQHEQGHVIVLWSTCSKRVCGLKDRIQNLTGGSILRRAGSHNHPFLAPLFIVFGHGFTDAVHIKQQHISRLKHDCLLGIRSERQETYHRTTCFEPDCLIPANYNRGIMPSVHAFKGARRRIVGGEKEGRIAIRRGCLIDQTVHLVH